MHVIALIKTFINLVKVFAAVLILENCQWKKNHTNYTTIKNYRIQSIIQFFCVNMEIIEISQAQMLKPSKHLFFFTDKGD